MTKTTIPGKNINYLNDNRESSNEEIAGNSKIHNRM